MMSGHEPEVRSDDLSLVVGNLVTWGKNVVFGPNCRSVSIGHGCFIGNDIYIDVEELRLGDYVTIHHGTVIHGKNCIIGHNCWIGHYSILDALGGLLMGNNLGVGAQSQLWSHMKFGDVLAGCRWRRFDSLEIGDDVWFVGHCIVAPIRAEPKSMLLVGGVAVKDLRANHIYSGVPARDVTDRMGKQFRERVSYEEKEAVFRGYVEEFRNLGNESDFIQPCREFPIEPDSAHTWFNLDKREYLPTYSEKEYLFMKFLLYDRAKFVPRHNPH